MPLTDHVTDEQLNEYLDNETTSAVRARIETHVSACAECAARLTALQTLFAEIESLPELDLSKPLAALFTRPSSPPVAQLPRWLTLTLTLPVVAAFIAIVFILPLVTQYLGPVIRVVSIPTFRD